MRNRFAGGVLSKVSGTYYGLQARRRELRLKPSTCPVCEGASVGSFVVHEDCNAFVRAVYDSGGIELVRVRCAGLKSWKNWAEIKVLLNKKRPVNRHKEGVDAVR